MQLRTFALPETHFSSTADACLTIGYQCRITHFPLTFAAASAKPVSLVKPLTPEEARLVPESAVTDLVSCGYRPEEVATALQGCRGDREAAFVQLYSRLTGTIPKRQLVWSSRCLAQSTN